MNKKAGILVAVLAVGFMCSCAPHPERTITQEDSRPSIGVAGAPKGASLIINGLNMGPAAAYNGDDTVLLIERGKHNVEVVHKGQVIHSEVVFLGDSTTKIIHVNP